ncbi:MAG: sugar phosphate isomerase/epimerase family protein [Nitrolancea sp.]
MLSITTDYLRDVGSPEPYLRRIAEAGFSHIHWCHHWNDDFLYANAEIEQIGRWLEDFGLKLNDLHASAGHEKCWTSTVDHERQAGVELVRNRIDMTARLGGDVIILHMPAAPSDEAHSQRFSDVLHRSFDALQTFAAERGVRLALENLTDGNFATVRQVLSEYPAEFVGHCYDSGHGNITGDGLDQLDLVKERLISLHLHDNDAVSDDHQPLFTATVDWPRLAGIIAQSSYVKMVSLEVQMHHSGIEDEMTFLASAREGGERFAQMIEDARA